MQRNQLGEILKEIKEKTMANSLYNHACYSPNYLADDLDTKLAKWIHHILIGTTDEIIDFRFINYVISNTLKNLKKQGIKSKKSKIPISLNSGIMVYFFPFDSTLEIEYSSVDSKENSRYDTITPTEYKAYVLKLKKGELVPTDIDLTKEPIFDEQRVKLLQKVFIEYSLETKAKLDISNKKTEPHLN